MSDISRKALSLAKRWLKDIEETKSPTALLASVALSEIDALEKQFPLGSSAESEGEATRLREALVIAESILRELHTQIGQDIDINPSAKRVYLSKIEYAGNTVLRQALSSHREDESTV